MGRPKEIGIDYFSFDVDLFEDEKVLPVSVEYGAKGECVVVRLLCAIYRDGYFAQWSEGLKFKLANQAKVSEHLVSDVVLKLVKYHFFDEELFTRQQILTSAGIQKRWNEATRKRVDLDEKPFWLIGDKRVSGGRNPVSGGRKAEETPITQSESTQSKLNKRKENKKPPLIPPAGENGGEIFITKKQRKLSGKRLETFLKFWKKFDYPKGKTQAADSWMDIPELTNALCEKIFLAAEMEAKHRPQILVAGKTPKMAQGWITERRWEDEIYLVKKTETEAKQTQKPKVW